MSKELKVKGNEREILGKYFEFLHENEELYAEEFDSKHDEYRDIIQKEKTDYVSKKRNLLPIHKMLCLFIKTSNYKSKYSVYKH